MKTKQWLACKHSVFVVKMTNRIINVSYELKKPTMGLIFIVALLACKLIVLWVLSENRKQNRALPSVYLF